MIEQMKIQGRILTGEDINFIIGMIKDNPGWHRTRISQEICRAWKWQTPYGQLKDMACRTMLLKLERRGFILLPSARRPSNNDKRSCLIPVLHETTPLDGKLSDVTPVKIQIITQRHERELFKTYMSLYHYLGLNTLVGENIQYLIKSRDNVPLACLLFGAAAWKTSPRDRFIGWGQQEREQNLYLIANNHRFLIFPWVRVKFLASHILSIIVKRLSDDWFDKYKHRIVLAETFVECERFSGSCYKGAGWKSVGTTKGRGKDDIHNQQRLPVKHVMVYPLINKFRSHLTEQVHG
ncbi:MAG TPA: Druantia anti-phage system protein DruA [Bacteroidales bacterium]|nr:Druantia anti-phage system protein DruA [Bacteroidales bacterium]